MSTKADFTYLVALQEQDSTRNILRPAVNVPKKIEIKVERPAIKPLNTVADSLMKKRKTSIQRPARKAITQNVKTEPSIDPSLPDTLDHVLIADWEISGYSKTLWTSQSKDSVSLLPTAYYRDSITGQKQIASGMREMPGKEKYDSIIIAQKSVEVAEEIEIDNTNLVMPQRYERPLLSQNWFLVVIIFQVALTGFIRFKWPKYLSDIFNAILFPNMGNKMQNTIGRREKVASFWLGFLFYANFSLLIFETMRISQRTLFNLTGWQLLVILFVFLIVIISLKFVVYHFAGWIFRLKEPTSEYLFQSSLMSKAFGVIILPLVVLFPFLSTESRIWVPRIGLTVFVLLYLIQIGRGIVTNLRNTLSVYYIILYLCALEILPLSILYKVLFY
jgi:hypothetical protein